MDGQFIVTMTGLVVTSGACMLDKIDGTVFATLVAGLVAGFMALQAKKG